ncbi:oxidoreductase [Catenulispora subtropica]|uniref:Aldo/keto reductase n=1 Tax=Catenulispora subtropica TaxID=450798 RepID=A0ABN2SYX2_9ACTN
MIEPTTPAAFDDFQLGGDLPVHRIGFGAMRLAQGTFQGPVRDPDTGMAVLRRAVELGVNHIDTAGFYGAHGVHANDLIRKALAPYQEDLVIATKVGPLRDDNGMPSLEATPDQLRALVEADLRTLGLQHLDLVYLRVGGMTGPGGAPLTERLGALADLRTEGLIRHLGISNVDTAQFEEASTVAPLAAVQNHFHVQHQTDTALLARCTEQHIAFVPFFPIGGGFQPLDAPSLLKVASRLEATPAQVAQAWLLSVSPNILLIPGTGSLEHLEENVAAGALRLSPEDLADLTAPADSASPGH